VPAFSAILTSILHLAGEILQTQSACSYASRQRILDLEGVALKGSLVVEPREAISHRRVDLTIHGYEWAHLLG